MKLTVIPLETPSHMRVIDGCFVQTRPNTGAVFGWTTTHLVEHCPMSYRYFPHCAKGVQLFSTPLLRRGVTMFGFDLTSLWSVQQFAPRITRTSLQ